MDTAIHAKTSRRIYTVVALFLAVTLGACAAALLATEEMPPMPPTISYSYLTDREMADAVGQAERFCAEYDARPRNSGNAPNEDGTAIMEFTCDRPLAAAAVSAPQPDPAPRAIHYNYNYRNDRELVDATVSARTYYRKFDTLAKPGDPTPDADGSTGVIFDGYRRIRTF